MLAFRSIYTDIQTVLPTETFSTAGMTKKKTQAGRGEGGGGSGHALEGGGPELEKQAGLSEHIHR